MSDVSFPYRRALVTGASGGIGAALATALAEAGVEQLVLVARRTDRLQALALALPCETRVITADLTDEDDLAVVCGAVAEVDLLINNAGFGSMGSFSSLDVARERSMVRLNCEVPLTLGAAALQGMVSRGHGCVANIASGMSFQPMPFMSTYAATKAFLLHWSEGVREELRGTGVSMVTVCPGSIATEFNKRAGVPDRFIAMKLVTGSMEGVVQATLSAIRSDRGVVTPGLGNFLGSLSSRWFPRAMVRRVLSWVLRPVADSAQKLSG